MRTSNHPEYSWSPGHKIELFTRCNLFLPECRLHQHPAKRQPLCFHWRFNSPSFRCIIRTISSMTSSSNSFGPIHCNLQHFAPTIHLVWTIKRRIFHDILRLIAVVAAPAVGINCFSLFPQVVLVTFVFRQCLANVKNYGSEPWLINHLSGIILRRVFP